MQFEKPKTKPKITKLDQLFTDCLENLTKIADESYENYDFHHPALKIREFLWEIFASHYIEIIKNRAYNQEEKFTKEESDSARYTLYYLLERLIILLYPIIPQVTSAFSSALKINLEEFPESKKINSNLILIEKIMLFDSEIWKAKKDKGLSLRDSLEGIKIPQELKSFEGDLNACHNLQ